MKIEGIKELVSKWTSPRKGYNGGEVTFFLDGREITIGAGLFELLSKIPSEHAIPLEELVTSVSFVDKLVKEGLVTESKGTYQRLSKLDELDSWSIIGYHQSRGQVKRRYRTLGILGVESTTCELECNVKGLPSFLAWNEPDVIPWLVY